MSSPNSEQTTQPIVTKVHQSSLFGPLNKVTTLSKLLAAVVFITLPFMGFYLGYIQAPIQTTEPYQTVMVADLSPSAIETEAVAGPVPSYIADAQISPLIFTRVLEKGSGNGSYYEVLEILVKEDGGKIRSVAQVGNESESPQYFEISPDKKLLAVNLDSKLILINIETGEVRDLYVPNFVVGGAVAFSPDSQKIALVDGNNYTHSTSTSLVVVDIPTSVVTELHKAMKTEHRAGTYLQSLYSDVVGWYGDIIVLSNVIGTDARCGEIPYSYYDVKKSQIELIRQDVYFAPLQYVTKKGVFHVTKINPSVPDSLKGEYPRVSAGCSDEIQNALSQSLSVKNIDTEEEHVIKVAKGSFPIIIAFSPDGLEVLYREVAIPNSHDEYYYSPTTIGYSTLRLDGTNQVESAVDYKKKLYSWGIVPMPNTGHSDFYSVEGFKQRVLIKENW